MSIKIGNTSISGLYVGSKRAEAVYLGSNLIWSAAPTHKSYTLTITSVDDQAGAYNYVTVFVNGEGGDVLDYVGDSVSIPKGATVDLYVDVIGDNAIGQVSSDPAHGDPWIMDQDYSVSITVVPV